MSKINLTALTDNTRTVVVPITLENEDGTSAIEEIRVRYRSMSMKQAREMEAAGKEIENEADRVIHQLSQLIVGLPDVIDEDGNEVRPDAAFFEALDIQYLRAFSEAVARDLNPNG